MYKGCAGSHLAFQAPWVGGVGPLPSWAAAGVGADQKLGGAFVEEPAVVDPELAVAAVVGPVAVVP